MMTTIQPVDKEKFMKGKCITVLFPLVFLLLTAPAYGAGRWQGGLEDGQIAAEIEALLEEKEISCDQAVYFTLAIALDTPPGGSQAAFDLAKERGWLPAKAEFSSPITMDSLSLLMMNAFEFKGGMMYRFTKSSRYAYRELKSRGFLGERSYPTQTVSGEQFLEIMDYVTGGEEDIW